MTKILSLGCLVASVCIVAINMHNYEDGQTYDLMEVIQPEVVYAPTGTCPSLTAGSSACIPHSQFDRVFNLAKERLTRETEKSVRLQDALMRLQACEIMLDRVGEASQETHKHEDVGVIIDIQQNSPNEQIEAVDTEGQNI